MKIVTFNLRMDTPADGPNRFANRREAIVERIRSEAPDVLGFQEALPAMYDYLRAQLPAYTFLGHGRSAQYLGEANPIAFRTDRFGRFSDIYTVPGIWIDFFALRAGLEFLIIILGTRSASVAKFPFTIKIPVRKAGFLPMRIRYGIQNGFFLDQLYRVLSGGIFRQN